MKTDRGVGVVGLLGVAFVVLKLIGYIDWSWWWVTAPFWGGLVGGLLFLVIYLFFVLLSMFKEENKDKYPYMNSGTRNQINKKRSKKNDRK